MKVHMRLLTVLASTGWLVACGGGQSSPTIYGAVPVSGQADGGNSVIEDRRVDPAPWDLSAADLSSKRSPAEILGLARPERITSDLESPSRLPIRAPNPSPELQVALNRFCPQEVIRWTSPLGGGGRCVARTPLGTAPPRSERLESEEPEHLGSILLECVRSVDGRAYWRAASFSAPTCRQTSEPPLEDALDLARRSNCMMCHQEDGTNPIGAPSFQQVADRYRLNPLPPGELESRIYLGSSGAWGNVPMPPNPQANAYTLSILLPWILNR